MKPPCCDGSHIAPVRGPATRAPDGTYPSWESVCARCGWAVIAERGQRWYVKTAYTIHEEVVEPFA